MGSHTQRDHRIRFDMRSLSIHILELDASHHLIGIAAHVIAKHPDKLAALNRRKPFFAGFLVTVFVRSRICCVVNAKLMFLGMMGKPMQPVMVRKDQSPYCS